MNPALKEKILSQLSQMEGQVGFYYKNLVTGETLAYHENEQFMAASVVKLPLLAAIMLWREQGKTCFDEHITVHKEQMHPDSSGVLAFMTGDEDGSVTLDIKTLCNFMIIISDTTATNALYHHYGNELEVLEAVRECGGYYATHMRNESSQLIESVREALQVARAAGVPLQISHHKSLCKELWRTAVKETTAMIEQARAEGLDVMCDQYPYNASSTGISSNLPGWAFEGGFDEFLTRIHTPDVRARMILQADQSHLGRWQDIHVAYVKSEKNQWMLGQNVVELGKTLGKTPADVVIDLVEEERNCVNEVDFGMCEEDIEYIMQKPYVAICSDGQALSLEAVGQPHPRHFGAFTRVLSHYSRDRGLFPLETAVQKMTSLPASRIGLQDRGLLRIGMWADMVQFDLAVLDSAPTYSAPKQASLGIERVFVNGVLTAENGKHLGVRAGHILRSH